MERCRGVPRHSGIAILPDKVHAGAQEEHAAEAALRILNRLAEPWTVDPAAPQGMTVAKPNSAHLVAMLARWTVAMPHILHHHVTEFTGLPPQLQVRGVTKPRLCRAASCGRLPVRQQQSQC